MTQQDERALAVTEHAGELAQVSGNPIADMMRAMIEKGITSENATAFEKMCDTVLKMDAVQAKRQYAVAKAALQAELTPIMAIRVVENKDGTVRWRWAKKGDIMQVLQPHLTAHGFSVGFNTRSDDNRITAICTLTHIGGHSESNEYATRNKSGPPGASDAQVDGSNATYACRYALMHALNLDVQHDDNAALEGAIIDEAKALTLREGFRATYANDKAFADAEPSLLKLGHATMWAAIREAKLPELEKLLADRQKKVKGAATVEGTPTPAAGAGANVVVQATPPSAPTPSALRQEVYDCVRAIAQNRRITLEEQWARIVRRTKQPALTTLWNLPEGDLPTLLESCRRVATQENADLLAFLPGGPAHETMQEREPGE